MGNPFQGCPFSCFLCCPLGGLRHGAGLLLQENESEVMPEKVNMGLC